MQENKKLVKDNIEGLAEWDWNEGAIKRFKFDVYEVAELEEGKTVFRGDTAFFLE